MLLRLARKDNANDSSVIWYQSRGQMAMKTQELFCFWWDNLRSRSSIGWTIFVFEMQALFNFLPNVIYKGYQVVKKIGLSYERL